MIKVEFTCTLDLLDYSKRPPNDYVRVRPGLYEIEEIPNPRSKYGAKWYRIVGTFLGGTVDWFNSQIRLRKIVRRYE